MTEQLRLEHRVDCPAGRVDMTVHEAEGITTLHCLECGSHAAFNTVDNSRRPEPLGVGPLAGTKVGADFTADMSVAGTRTPKKSRNWSTHD